MQNIVATNRPLRPAFVIGTIQQFAKISLGTKQPWNCTPKMVVSCVVWR